MYRSLTIACLLLSAPANAQHGHSQHSGASTSPTEIGQSAFAALSEIVTILKEDPETNWDTVNISALRRHLVDMELLTTEATVTAVNIPRGARFEVRGTGRVLEAIRAMVPAHAPFLAAETGWDAVPENLSDGVALIVEGDVAQIQALGFFGMMTIGAHHQDHHLLIAKEGMAHR